ncbi:hypothetical protein GCM10027416_22930 [Okibacterium endophyticum]
MAMRESAGPGAYAPLSVCITNPDSRKVVNNRKVVLRLMLASTDSSVRLRDLFATKVSKESAR